MQINNAMFQQVETSKITSDAAVSLNRLLRVAMLPLLATLAFLAIMYWAVLVTSDGRDDEMVTIMNAVGPITLFGSTAVAAFFTIRRYPISIWTPYIGFLAQTALFFGFGPLVYVFGSDSTISRLNSHALRITEIQLLQTNLLVATGVLSALFGFVFAGKLLRKIKNPDSSIKISLPKLAIVFLSAGFIVKFGLLLPYQFGMTNFVLPGFISTISELFILGLALTGMLAVLKGKPWSMLFWVLVPLNVFVGVLQFSKTAALTSLIVPGLGCYFAHRNWRRSAMWVIAAAVLYVWMQPLVGYGRGAIMTETGTIYRAGLPERFSILVSFLKEGQHRSVWDQDDQPAWTRLAYSGPQAYAMGLYDSGQSSATLTNVWVIFIPRVLWPNKPVGIGPGMDFYEMVTGRRGTYLGLSVYGDGYWQGGWLGVICVGLFMGTLLGWFSNNSLRWIANGHFVYLPLILMALLTGILGPTKYVINGLIGPIPIYVAYLFIIRILTSKKLLR